MENDDAPAYVYVIVKISPANAWVPPYPTEPDRPKRVSGKDPTVRFHTNPVIFN